MIYISYGLGNEFSLEKFKPIHELRHHPKPEGGLWASPVDGIRTWKTFCKESDFRKDGFSTSFKFTIKPGAKVYKIDGLDSILNFPGSYENTYRGLFTTTRIHWEEVVKEFDAVELVWSGLVAFEELYFERNPFYFWDCESILILNPSIIEPVV